MKLLSQLLYLFQKTNGVSVGLSLFILLSSTAAVSAAERVRFFVGPKEVVVSTDALETFANTGEIVDEFSFYSQYLDEDALEWFQGFLSQEHEFPIAPLNRMLSSTIGQDLLEELGEVIRTQANLNGHQALKAAFLTAGTGESNSIRMIDVFRQFPSESIRINSELLLEAKNVLSIYGDYAVAVTEAVAISASNNTVEPTDFSGPLSMPGPYQFTTSTETLSSRQVRQTGRGLEGSYSFDVDIYLPEESAWPAPLIAVSHGFGSRKENFTFMAEHLASHGFAVVVPEHVGSDLQYRKEFLQGNLSSALSPLEYLDRPRDISFVLDEMERLNQENPDLAGAINLDNIGVLGASLGGTTVLSLAGATLNPDRLAYDCAAPRLNLNFSQILQCQARFLPPLDLDLKDPRVDAAIAAHPLTSSIFGPEGMGEIEIPLALIAGDTDLVTPFVVDQAHPFVWMDNPDKYLVLLDPGTHWATTLQSGATGTEAIPKFLLGDTSETGREIFKALSIAFFNRYLNQNEAFSDFLAPRSVKGAVGENPLTMHLVRDLSPEAIEASFGGTPPIPIVPPPVSEEGPLLAEGDLVLPDIARTEALKVGIRRDAPPFGYIDAEGQWTGFCTEFSKAFASSGKNS